MSQRHLLQIGFVLLCALFSATSYADKDLKLVVFGDSLSDPGNLYALTGLSVQAPYELIPSAPYVIGDYHLTNGDTWVEQLADKLDIKSGPAFVKTRYGNYAVGGARARATGFMDLTSQVGSYLANDKLKDTSRTLYVIMIGGNDVRDAIEALQTDVTGASSLQILTAAVTSVSDNILALQAAGARHIVVANAPDLAIVPALIMAGPQAQGAAHFMSVSYNTALDNLLNQLEMFLPVEFMRLDLYSFLYAVTSMPANYGLVNVTMPCLSFGVVENAVCAQPDDYLFWDGIHPTTKGHAKIAEYAASVLFNKKE
ncbi:MAG: SGNH/GDSL hydrolase family protein [Gammaproteobacteria bacterium]|jgi:phospholipase/lecithinase/hemolysin|nr:SGNH/GDSL hydrolase family protein [Gammaproteobacteria bacterium]